MFNKYIHNLYLLCNDYNINCYKHRRAQNPNIGILFISSNILKLKTIKLFQNKCAFNIDVTKKK